MQKSQELEILDLGSNHYTTEEYHDCLRKLGRVGRWLGGDAATLRALRRATPAPQSILDVGCGGGAFTILMAQQYPQAQVVGTEINPLAIDHANSLLATLAPSPDNVSFQLLDQAALNAPPHSVDIIIATLVCHHMDEAALINFLKKACSVARKKVIINDLHRHRLAVWAFQVIAPLFFNNRLILHDGPLSVQRAFTRSEWIHYLEAAGIPPNRYTIRWQWAFRWLVEIEGEAS